jgi:hypothetical protein
VNVLCRFREALVPDGIVLDLQVIRPHPKVEVNGQLICEADGSALFETADAARDAVDLLIEEQLLAEEAVDDHDVLQHYETGAALVQDWEPKQRSLPPAAIDQLLEMKGEVVVRERCRLRRLRRVDR